jgi:hypothetical protein
MLAPGSTMTPRPSHTSSPMVIGATRRSRPGSIWCMSSSTMLTSGPTSTESPRMIVEPATTSTP